MLKHILLSDLGDKYMALTMTLIISLPLLLLVFKDFHDKKGENYVLEGGERMLSRS